MFCKTTITALCLAAVAAITIAAAQPSKDSKSPTPSAPAAGQPEIKLPPGWTPADMQACMDAGTPGKMHEWLAKGAGTWQGKSQMWMGPGSEPMASEVTNTVTAILDGRYTKCEYKGEIPGMGPFTGYGTSGFDNVSQKFVSTWIDNHSTGIMNGTGELSSDSKVLTMNYAYNCPVTKKQTVMREVTTFTGTNTMTLDMYTIEPKSGKEYKMMHVDFTRK